MKRWYEKDFIENAFRERKINIKCVLYNYERILDDERLGTLPKCAKRIKEIRRILRFFDAELQLDMPDHNHFRLNRRRKQRIGSRRRYRIFLSLYKKEERVSDMSIQ